MIRNEYTLKVDIKKHNTSIIPTFVQYDSASLIFKVYDNGVILDLSKFTNSEIAHLRPDGTTVVGNGEVITLPNGDTALKYKYLGSEMRFIGNVATSLSLFDDQKKISILPFDVKIVKDIRDGFISAPTEEVGYLQELIVKVTKILEEAIEHNETISNLIKDVTEKAEFIDKVVEKENDRIESEIKRESNETTRIAAENDRVVSETNRKTQEQLRIENEDTRIASEKDRLSEEEQRKLNEINRTANENERKVNEVARLELEDERIVSEIDRKSSELERKNSETSRIDEENIRLSNEESRITFENDRIASELLRKSSETVRIENEDERIVNETARQTEESKRIAAESARVSDMNNRIHRRDYSPSTNYVKHNEVFYNGSSWRCIVDNVGQVPIEGQYWTLVAQRGTDGKGSVASVNGALPDNTGNVNLLPINIGAAPSDHTHSELHSHSNKNVLDGLAEEQGKLKYKGQEIGSVTSVNGKTGEVNITPIDIGLDKVDNTRDIEKPISLLTQTALDLKIPTNREGVANGIALLNADGKVIDADGNLVEGKVKSVNSILPNDNGDIIIPPLSSEDINVIEEKSPDDLPSSYENGYSIFNVDATRIEWESLSETFSSTSIIVETVLLDKNLTKQRISTVRNNTLVKIVERVGNTDLSWGEITTIYPTDSNAQLASYQFVLETTEPSQTSWKIPLVSFNPINDTIIVIRNTSTLAPTMYRIDELLDGYYVTLTIPTIESPEDNNIGVIILKNVKANFDEMISGKLLIDGSVSIDKLTSELIAMIEKARDAASQQELSELNTNFTHHSNLIASTQSLGHIMVDGTSITVDERGVAKVDFSIIVDDMSSLIDSHKTGIATTQVLGHIKSDGDTITVDSNGVAKANYKASVDSVTSNINTHKTAVATTTTLGHIKVGQNLTIGADGTLNASASAVPDATTSQKGIVQLLNSVSSTSTAQAATPYAVKLAYDVGNSALSRLSAGSVALGIGASATGDAAVALGQNCYAPASFGIALGYNARANQENTLAIGYGVSATMYSDARLGTSTNGYGIWNWLIPGQLYVSGTKNFQMAHPNPEKKATHVIRHGAVESPTTGDTLYRYTLEATTDNQIVEIELPDYFEHLNINVDVWVNPHLHFGRAYGVVEGDKLKVTCETAGQYKALIIGTRNDDDVQDWYIKGVEREIGETWQGETYEFEVTEYTEVLEIKEEIQ